MSESFQLESDSEDEIPPGWVERVTGAGKVYYANHVTHHTQWEHPNSGRMKIVSEELPFGWEKRISWDGTVTFVDRNKQRTSFTDPRLAFAREVSNLQMDFRQRFDGSSMAMEVLHGSNLSGQYVIVTGANSGIGYETARSLALYGATVIMACRTLDTAERCRTAITDELPTAAVEMMPLDLASLSSIKQFTDAYKARRWPLNSLILNAAVFGTTWQQTVDGLEMMFQVNHLGHFYLALLLQTLLIDSAPARVVVVSSESHRFAHLTVDDVTESRLSPSTDDGFVAIHAYNTSKLCNILFANAFSAHLHGTGVMVNSLHPGNMMNSSLSRHWWLWKIIFTIACPFTKSMQQGAATTVFCATAPELAGVSGAYFNNCCICRASSASTDARVAETLWDVSLDILHRTVGHVLTV